MAAEVLLDDHAEITHDLPLLGSLIQDKSRRRVDKLSAAAVLEVLLAGLSRGWRANTSHAHGSDVR